MKMTNHDLHRISFLRYGIILIIIVLIGCSQRNESKIIGTWNAPGVKADMPYSVSYKFHKEGGVKKEAFTTDKKVKITGKYKFKDKKNISIAWDDGNNEIINIEFPNNDTLILYGNIKLNRIKTENK